MSTNYPTLSDVKELQSHKVGGVIRLSSLLKGFVLPPESYLELLLAEDITQGEQDPPTYHKERSKYVFILSGRFRVSCEDVQRGKKNYVLEPKSGLYIPAYILHSSSALKAGNALILANTKLEREGKSFKDTYTETEFRKLQNRVS